MKRIAILGAGLIGRLVALQLHRSGCDVTLFDKGDKGASQSAAYAAAGLLTPLGESLHCEPNIVQMGVESLTLWPKILATLTKNTSFQQAGAIMVNHEQDQGDYLRFNRHIQKYYSDANVKYLTPEALAHLEPELKHFKQGLYLPEEGQIDNRQLLEALQFELELEEVKWESETAVTPLSIHTNGCELQMDSLNNEIESSTISFDYVVDCRGLGAQNSSKQNLEGKNRDTYQLSDLRGVRGEVFRLYAPQVTLSRPVRLMHPRYQLYIAPKDNHMYTVGASEIESDDLSPVTVRSALELLSAAYSVHPGFAEANIIEHISQCRPALSDNQPQIIDQDKLIQVNGLYRHGYLISPVILEQVLTLVLSKVNQTPAKFAYDHWLPVSYVNEISNQSRITVNENELTPVIM